MKWMRKGKPEPEEKVRIECPRVAADPDQGLTEAQAAERLENGYANVVTEETATSAKKIVLSNVFTYFNMIFFLLALVLLWEGSFNNLTFLIVVTVNAVIGIVQELKAKKTLDDLRLVSAPEITVIRDGQERQVPGELLVLDDADDRIHDHHDQEGQIVEGPLPQQHQGQQEEDQVKIGKYIGKYNMTGSLRRFLCHHIGVAVFQPLSGLGFRQALPGIRLHPGAFYGFGLRGAIPPELLFPIHGFPLFLQYGACRPFFSIMARFYDRIMTNRNFLLFPAYTTPGISATGILKPLYRWEKSHYNR